MVSIILMRVSIYVNFGISVRAVGNSLNKLCVIMSEVNFLFRENVSFLNCHRLLADIFSFSTSAIKLKKCSCLCASGDIFKLLRTTVLEFVKSSIDFLHDVIPEKLM